MYLILFLVMYQPNPSWVWQSEDLYLPLTSSHVHITPNLDFYVVQYGENTIRHYNATGKLLTKFGRTGEGPGEFRNLFRVFFRSNKIFTYDVTSNAISTFDSDGIHLERRALTSDQTDPMKVANGWVNGNWNQYQYDPDGTAQVFWSDTTMAEAQPIFKVRGRGTHGTFVNDGVTSVYSPISATAKMAVNPRGTRVFVADANGFRIRVIDPASKKVIRTIKREEKSLAFNPDWADIRLNQVKRDMPKIKFKTNYPEYFPIIRRIFVNHKGWLIADKWTRTPHLSHDPIVLDEFGREVPTEVDYELLIRWVGDDGEMAYLTTYDDDRQLAGLVKVPHKDALAFVRANPFPQD